MPDTDPDEKMESNRHRIKTSSDWAGIFSIPRSLDNTYYPRHYYGEDPSTTPPLERRSTHLSRHRPATSSVGEGGGAYAT